MGRFWRFWDRRGKRAASQDGLLEDRAHRIAGRLLSGQRRLADRLNGMAIGGRRKWALLMIGAFVLAMGLYFGWLVLGAIF